MATEIEANPLPVDEAPTEMDVDETPAAKKSRSRSALNSLAAMDSRNFKKAIAEIDSVGTLKKYQNSDKLDDDKLAVIDARVTKLSKQLIFDGALREFERRIGLIDSFGKLNKLRFVLNSASYTEDEAMKRKKLNIVEKRMRAISETGAVVKRVRKAGTGTKVEEEHIYTDNKANRDAGRVGQTYKKVKYTDAEYEERPVKMRRIRRTSAGGEDKPKRTNMWIEAVQQAKAALGAPSFVIVRKEVSDPSDAQQVMGQKVYQKACEIMAAAKASQAASE